jgi:hypothetical protein
VIGAPYTSAGGSAGGPNVGASSEIVSSATPRFIYSRFGARQVPELLQTIAAAELISPSRCLWLVSPWVSDIVVLDNRSNAFTTLEPSWARARVRLSTFIGKLAASGSTVHVATRPDDHNREFITRLREFDSPMSGRVVVHESAELHQKGILGDRFHLAGSMNLTFNGISVNDEALLFTVESATVAEQQLVYRAHWGGE